MEFTFLERLAIADDLELDTTPGSEAWSVATREARRVAAGIPARLLTSRGPDLIDEALAVLAPLGLKYVSHHHVHNDVRCGAE